MSKKLKRLALTATLCAAAAAAGAQTLKGVTVEPASAKVGEPVQVRASFDLGDSPNCGVKVHFGDGATTDAKVNQAKDAVIAVPHTYGKAGTYTVMVEPKRVDASLKCQGKNAKTSVVVAVAAPVAATPAAPAPAVAAAKAKPAGPTCPPGWTLSAKSVNKKTGAFQCLAKAGTPAPTAKLECPGNLSYVENTKKGMLACQP
jgi:hypothetical protein